MGTVDLPAFIDVEKADGFVRVTIGGNITDRADLSEAAAVQAPKVVLDLENLHRINSRGVILWMDMIDSICKKSGRVEIQNASHGFMLQYSMIRRFSGTARIESVMATFQCEDCQDTKTIALHRAQDFPDGRVRPKVLPRCKRCKSEMVPDDPIFDVDLSQ